MAAARNHIINVVKAQDRAKRGGKRAAAARQAARGRLPLESAIDREAESLQRRISRGQ